MNRVTMPDISEEKADVNEQLSAFQPNPRVEKRIAQLRQETLMVFCPPMYESLVKNLLSTYGLKYTLNSHKQTSRQDGYKYLHFSSKLLEDDDKDFLVEKIKYGFYVRPLVDCLDEHFGFTFIEFLNSDYFLHQKSFSSLSRRNLWVIKRLTDMAYASVLLTMVFPISLLIALMIKLDSRGPVFYKQVRIGKFNKPFTLLKFRSMRVDAEKNGAQWAAKDDDRITRIGRIIRATRLDELPQLINVLRGDMSLIGPRPEREVFISDLEDYIPYYRFRHAVKPGITGWAQVNYPYGASIDDARWKHRYDIWYIKHQSFWLDIKIIFKTIGVVLFGKGR